MAKKGFKAVLIFIGIIILCIGIMVGSAYIYIESSIRTADAATSKSSEPYNEPLPSSVGILFKLPSNNGYLFYLDFLNSELLIACIDNLTEDTEGTQEYYGYPVSYRLSCSNEFIADFIDRIGGIEFYENGKNLRYTGYQIVDKVQSLKDNRDLKREVLRRIFDKISDVGLTKDDFAFIISQTDTDLTIPDCYFWPPYFTKIAEKARFIN